MYMKCPYADIDTDTQTNKFFNGLNPTSKSHDNASAGGSLSSESAKGIWIIWYDGYEISTMGSREFTEKVLRC